MSKKELLDMWKEVHSSLSEAIDGLEELLETLEANGVSVGTFRTYILEQLRSNLDDESGFCDSNNLDRIYEKIEEEFE